jgi:hypothetical protein
MDRVGHLAHVGGENAVLRPDRADGLYAIGEGELLIEPIRPLYTNSIYAPIAAASFIWLRFR